MNDTRARLAVRDLTVSLPDRRLLLRTPRFDVYPGETVILSSESGRGKTTLLKILAGLISSRRSVIGWSGTITVDGATLGTVPITEYRRRIYWLAQKPPLEPGTVRSTFNAILRYRSGPLRDGAAYTYEKTMATVETLFDTLGLSRSLLDQHVTSISGGEASRVAIVRMLLVSRPLLLLDEPSAGLDAERSRGLLGLIRGYLPDAAIVVASHDESLNGDADTRFVLESGELVEVRA